MEENVIMSKFDKKKVIIIVAVVVGVLLGIYLGASFWFTSHFFPGTKIGSIDVSGKSELQVKTDILLKLGEYELSVVERDGTVNKVTGEDIDLNIEWKTEPQTYIDKQNGFAWIVKLFAPDTYAFDGEFVYDQAQLIAKVEKFEAMKPEKQVPAVNAKVSEYSISKGYTLVPSVPGTEVNQFNLLMAIDKCIYNLENELIMADADCYVSPVIADDNEKLLAAIDQMNKCLDAKITYKVGSSTQILDADTFQPWLFVDENLDVKLNDEALSAYVKQLASTYNTCYSAKKFMTSYGQEITITNSHYGWKVDNEVEKAAILADILTGAPVTRDLNYSMTANSREGNDYGNSYVEINLTAQHLFVYVNGQMVLETDFVSGNLKNGWDSPTGIWGLTYKTKNAVLRGDNYATPVDFWMPFAGNVGMHDATWRKDFGGNYYKTDGSHGCINLPWSKARDIYGYISKNFPVIAYNLAGTESEKCIAMDQAEAMVKAIKAIGNVTLESEAAIVACRTQYDALSDMAKSYVTNYQVLVDAEAELARLKSVFETTTPETP